MGIGYLLSATERPILMFELIDFQRDTAHMFVSRLQLVRSNNTVCSCSQRPSRTEPNRTEPNRTENKRRLDLGTMFKDEPTLVSLVTRRNTSISPPLKEIRMKFRNAEGKIFASTVLPLNVGLFVKYNYSMRRFSRFSVLHARYRLA